jgi:hypothetical protein
VGCQKQFVIGLGFVLLLLTIRDSVAAPECATVATQSSLGKWTLDDGSTMDLDQNNNSGFISGTMNRVDGVYSITGTYVGSGRFNLTAQCPAATHSCYVLQISYSGTLHKPGCATATLSWTTSGASGTQTMSRPSYLPAGETTPQFQQWTDTYALYHQSLLPTNYNYGGRTIAESFPTAGTDTCWFPNSAYPYQAVGVAYPSITFGNSAPSGYSDSIGVGADRINYYRQHNRAPCGYTWYQRMSIDVLGNGGTTQYTGYITNTLYVGIGKTSITVNRAGGSAYQIWGTPVPPPGLIQSILNLLLLQ